REIDMPAAYHAEGIGRGEIAGVRQFAYRLLAGVDEVGVHLILIGERTHAEHAVLALQADVDAVGDVVRDQRRNADAEVDVIAVAQLFRRARCHLFTGPGHGKSPARSSRGARTGVAELDPLLAGADLDDAFDENAWCVDVVGIEFAGRNQLLDLGHG